MYPRSQTHKQQWKQKRSNPNIYTKTPPFSLLPSPAPSFLSYLFYSINKATWQQGHLTLTLLRRTRHSLRENVHDMTLVGNGSTSRCPFLSFTAKVIPDLGIHAWWRLLSISWALPGKQKGLASFCAQVLQEWQLHGRERARGWRWDHSWLAWAVPCVWGAWRRSPFQQFPSMMTASPAWTVGDAVCHRNHTQIPTFHCVLSPDCLLLFPSSWKYHASRNWSKSKPAALHCIWEHFPACLQWSRKPWSQTVASPANLLYSWTPANSSSSQPVSTCSDSGFLFLEKYPDRLYVCQMKGYHTVRSLLLGISLQLVFEEHLGFVFFFFN